MQRIKVLNYNTLFDKLIATTLLMVFRNRMRSLDCVSYWKTIANSLQILQYFFNLFTFTQWNRRPVVWAQGACVLSQFFERNYIYKIFIFDHWPPVTIFLQLIFLFTYLYYWCSPYQKIWIILLIKSTR